MWANLFECLFQFIVSRLGRWIDFEKDYKTLYPWFMETIWYGEREERGEGGEGRGGEGMEEVLCHMCIHTLVQVLSHLL